MKMRLKPVVIDVVEDDGMWLDKSTMTYYDKDALESIVEQQRFDEVDLEAEIMRCVVYEDMNFDQLAHHFYKLGHDKGFAEGESVGSNSIEH